MTGLSATVADLYLGYLRGSSVELPNTTGMVYLALGSTIPAADGTGFTELVDVTYARQPMALATTDWLTPSDRSIVNAKTIFFPDLTAASPQIKSWAVYSAVTAGTLIAFGTVDLPRTVNAASAPYFPAGSIKISMAKRSGAQAKGTSYANAQLNVFRGISPTPLTEVYIALGLQNPTVASGAVNIGEITATGYKRVSVAASAAQFTVISPRVLKNAQEIRFIQQDLLPDIVSQATTDWSPIKSFAIYDSLTATDPLYYGTLGEDAVVYKNDILRLAINALTISE